MPLGFSGVLGNHSEYDDPFSVMGNTSHGHFNARQKQMIGWLSAAQGDIQEVSGSGLFTLKPLAASGGLKALRLQRTAGSWLWLEHRQAVGAYDKDLAATAFTGAHIHLEDAWNTAPDSPHRQKTHLLNYTPPFGEDFRLAPLAVGGQWSDPFSDLTLRTVSLGAEGLTVEVRRDPLCLTLSPTERTHGASAEPGSISLAASASPCPWTALAGEEWITITSPTSGAGAGVVHYQLSPNPGPAPRTGAIAVGRRLFTVRQRGIPRAPEIVGVTPDAATGGGGVFVFSFKDENGLDDLELLRMSFALSPGITGACAAQVNVAAQLIWISNDAGTGWSGLMPMHEAWKLSNSRCFFGYAFTARAGPLQKVEIEVFLRGVNPSARNIYLWARDYDGLETGWVRAGAFSVINQPPFAAAAIPSSGEGSQREFSFTFTDDNGYDDFSFVRVLFNTVPSPVGGCALEYNRELDRVRLADDAGTGWSEWQVSHEGWKLGNSRCRISYVYPLTVGAELKLVARLFFRGAFGGLKNMYLSAQDRSGLSTGWQLRGTWMVPSMPPLASLSRLGTFHHGVWLLDVNGNHAWDAAVDVSFSLQLSGIPVTGDWNGDGRTKVGVYRDGIWRLDYNGNHQWDGAAGHEEFVFGWAGATPVVGDWNGDGRTNIGVYSNGFWFLDFNGNFTWDGETVDRRIAWGWPGATPVVGDWNAGGATKIGVYTDGFWFLDYDGDFAWNPHGFDKQVGWGWEGVQIVTGDWNGDGRTKIGAVNLGFWFLDFDGNYFWDGGLSDKIAGWGAPTHTPAPGKW